MSPHLLIPIPTFSALSAFPPICFIVQIFSLLIYSVKFDNHFDFQLNLAYTGPIGTTGVNFSKVPWVRSNSILLSHSSNQNIVPNMTKVMARLR